MKISRRDENLTIWMQAEAMRVPHIVMEIPAEPSYLEGYRSAIARLKEEHGIQALATGEQGVRDAGDSRASFGEGRLCGDVVLLPIPMRWPKASCVGE